MRPALWAEIHRLHEMEHLSRRQIARQLRLSRKTVNAALVSLEPTVHSPAKARASKLAPYKERIGELLRTYPTLSAVRIREILAREGYTGGLTQLRDYLSDVRPRPRQRVYQSVFWEPGEAIQVDWADCGSVVVDGVSRKVSVFGAVLVYSRMLYIEFTLDQKKETFYRGIVHALHYFDGIPRKTIVDNLKAAVLDGHGRTARFHPEFLDLCGHYRMQPVACQRRDPESKGIIEAAMKYVQTNALAGLELGRWEAYAGRAREWLSQINQRVHRTTAQRPVDRLTEEKLLPLPATPYDCRLVKQCVVTSHALVIFETNQYSVPPAVAGKPVTLKADDLTVWIYFHTEEVARHRRAYGRRQPVVNPAHRQAALDLRKRERDSDILARFGDLGPVALSFRRGLELAPVRRVGHMRAILRMVPLYGQTDVLQALELAVRHRTFDASSVQYLIEEARRRQARPSPLPLTPLRQDLLEEIHLSEPDPGLYDQWIEGEDTHED